MYIDGQCIVQFFSISATSSLVSLPLYEMANGNLFFAFAISSSAVILPPPNARSSAFVAIRKNQALSCRRLYRFHIYSFRNRLSIRRYRQVLVRGKRLPRGI